jgi:futalosine hydrolase
MEVEPLIEFFSLHAIAQEYNQFEFKKYNISLLISGIGIMHSLYHFMEHLHKSTPDFWIQAGIGGAIDRSLKPGQVVGLESEFVFGFGAEEKDGHIITPVQLGWMHEDDFPFTQERLRCPFITKDMNLPLATGMTTIHSHGSEDSISRLKQMAVGQVENMEGAAFFYVSLMKRIPFVSIRSISNYVTLRNRKYPWP